MKILIFYATIEGQTAKIARFVEDEVREAGHEGVLVNAADETASVSFKGIVHERRHPEAFEMFLAAKRHELEAQSTLLISVSLMAAFPSSLEEAREFATEMKMRTRFTPNEEALVAGAVRTSSYDYFSKQVLRHVVLRGRDYRPEDGDHEFTDWQALSSALSRFLAAEPHLESDCSWHFQRKRD